MTFSENLYIAYLILVWTTGKEIENVMEKFKEFKNGQIAQHKGLGYSRIIICMELCDLAKLGTPANVFRLGQENSL